MGRVLPLITVSKPVQRSSQVNSTGSSSVRENSLLLSEGFRVGRIHSCFGPDYYHRLRDLEKRARHVMKFVDFVSRDAIRTSIDVDDKEQVIRAQNKNGSVKLRFLRNTQLGPALVGLSASLKAARMRISADLALPCLVANQARRLPYSSHAGSLHLCS